MCWALEALTIIIGIIIALCQVFSLQANVSLDDRLVHKTGCRGFTQVLWFPRASSPSLPQYKIATNKPSFIIVPNNSWITVMISRGKR